MISSSDVLCIASTSKSIISSFTVSLDRLFAVTGSDFCFSLVPIQDTVFDKLRDGLDFGFITYHDSLARRNGHLESRGFPRLNKSAIVRVRSQKRECAEDGEMGDEMWCGDGTNEFE